MFIFKNIFLINFFWFWVQCKVPIGGIPKNMGPIRQLQLSQMPYFSNVPLHMGSIYPSKAQCKCHHEPNLYLDHKGPYVQSLRVGRVLCILNTQSLRMGGILHLLNTQSLRMRGILHLLNTQSLRMRGILHLLNTQSFKSGSNLTTISRCKPLSHLKGVGVRQLLFSRRDFHKHKTTSKYTRNCSKCLMVM